MTRRTGVDLGVCVTTLALVACAACTSREAAPEQPAPDVMPEAVSVPAQPAQPPQQEPAEPDPEPLPLRFAPVIEGECPYLDVSLVGSEVFMHTQPRAQLLHLLPDGTTEDLPIDEAALGLGPFYIEIGRIEAVEGAWPGPLFLRYMHLAGRMWEGSRYLERKDGVWTPLELRDEQANNNPGIDRMYRWTGGNWLARMSCRDYFECAKQDRGLLLRVIRGPGKAPKFPELRPAVDGCQTKYSLAVLPDGDIFAVGRFCHQRSQAEEGGAFYAVRWSEAGGTTIDRLPVAEATSREPGPIVAASATQVYAAVLTDTRDQSTALFAFDGAKWDKLPAIEGVFGGMDVDRGGALWAAVGGRLVRTAAGGVWEGLTFPTGPARQVGGLQDSVAWVAQEDGALWLRADGQDFVRAELPDPVFSSAAKYVVHGVKTAGRDVWVTATYDEKRPGWKEGQRRRALLRNAPGPATPLRCAPEGGSKLPGMYAWPPAARAGCTTIFAVLLRTSAWTRRDFAYPELGKLLKGQESLAGAKFSEVELGGQRIVGAVVPDLATGEALTLRVAGKIRRSRPELVCASPTELRALPFDLVTGKLTK